MNTLDAMISDADLCRLNGWVPGIFLVGDEGYGPTVIELTAIGKEHILARCISHQARVCSHNDEHSWTLKNREWKVL